MRKYFETSHQMFFRQWFHAEPGATRTHTHTHLCGQAGLNLRRLLRGMAGAVGDSSGGSAEHRGPRPVCLRVLLHQVFWDCREEERERQSDSIASSEPGS